MAQLVLMKMPDDAHEATVGDEFNRSMAKMSNTAPKAPMKPEIM